MTCEARGWGQHSHTKKSHSSLRRDKGRCQGSDEALSGRLFTSEARLVLLCECSTVHGRQAQPNGRRSHG